MQSPTPDRYGVENTVFQGNPAKALFRRDHGSKGNRALMVRGLSMDRNELEDDGHPHNHIYLDGAVQGPLYMKRRGIYSLDHHDACVRQITDATCIQALHLARTQIISALGYKIIGNDPDADTVFATWALLNADLIAHDERVFKRVQPLMLLEGNIDTYGFGFEELTGLSEDTISETRQRINWLMSEERELKQRGRWSTTDYVDYTDGALRKLDRYVLFRDSLDIPVAMQVHEVVQLTGDQTLHFVQAPDSGIYEVENTILHHEGSKNCACIIFYDGKAKVTIKLSGFVNQYGLIKVTEALNIVEDQRKKEQGITDPGMLNARWGGGDSIVGAPRYPNGSGPLLSTKEIVDTTTMALNRQMQS